MFDKAVYGWLLGTPLSQYLQQSQYAFAVCEKLHFIGLCLLLGAMIVIDLRMLGVMRRTPVEAVLKFVPVAAAGFALNLITGVGFLLYNPEGYVTNWMFWLKMGLILLAGVNMMIFTLVAQPKVLKTPQGEPFDNLTRICATASLALWVGVIIAGRLLPVFQGAAGKG